MEKMVIDNHKQTILNLLGEGEKLLRQIGDDENADRLRSTARDTEARKEPVIMFYGLYNAGKSTLGNALCHADLKTGDVPTTASIQTISWNGYTIIDTPGIDAHTEHTEIAENEIRRSDIIFFVMDNADGFDNEPVYNAIAAILKQEKPLAIVINQKKINISEDYDMPVPDRPSVRKIVEKVSVNLELCAVRHGVEEQKARCFLGIFPVHAREALEAYNESEADAQRTLIRTGIASLRNALNVTVRRSQVVYMLKTPLIDLRETLQRAMATYQSASIYGEKQELAKNREALLASRQRLRERLLSDGLRKIDVMLEEIKTAAANGQKVEGAEQKLSDALNALLKEVAGQEQALLQSEIKLEAMPEVKELSVRSQESEDTDDSGDDLSKLGDIAVAIITGMNIPLPTPVPPPIIWEAIKLIASLFFKKKASGKNDDEDVRRSQEQLANYYRWLNDLRDQEVKIKATYEKSVNDLVRQYYDPKLMQIDQALAEVDSSCAEHTANLRAMEQLVQRVGDEMVSLAVTA